MASLKVLVACECSGTVRTAFRAMGHDAWSADLLPSDDDSPYHIQGDVLKVLDGDWDLVIAHPPCTFLTNAGVRHLKSTISSVNGRTAKVCGVEREKAVIEAVEFFNRFRNCSAPRVAVENPIPHKYAKMFIGEYDQIIQPWQFGHGETKATCLWLKNLPPLQPTEVVIGREHRIHKMSPSSDRAKERSVTYPGIAVAMAAQWGGF